MNKFTNDTWLKDSNQRLKKGVWGIRVARIISTTIYIILLLVIGIVLWLSFSHSKEIYTEIDSITQYDTHTAQINKIDTVIYEDEDGIKSFGVQYVRCYEVATINGYKERCDRRIVRVSE